MDMRVLDQVTRRLRRAVQDKVRPVPAMATVVVWQGPGRWRAPLEVRQRLGGEVPVWLDPLVVRSGYVVAPLAALRRDPAAPASARVAANLLVQARVNQRALWARLLSLAEDAGQVLAVDGPRAAALWIRYIQGVTDARPDLAQRRALERLDPSMEAAMVTLADQLRNEGRDEGRQEGRDEARRAVLVELGALRWGAPPAQIATRIEAASGKELVAWTLRVLTAGDWSELVG